MSDIPKVLKALMAGVGGAVGYLFPGLSGPLYTLVALLIIDYMTGMMKATVTKTLSSRIGYKGIVKKVFMLVIIVMAGMIDINLGLNATMVTMTIFFYIANESLSILENAVELGVPVPDKLKDLLIQVQDDVEGESVNSVNITQAVRKRREFDYETKQALYESLIRKNGDE